MIEPLERVEALLLETYKLAKETSDIKDIGNAFFKNFGETKRNYDFINENLFLNNDSNQNSD